MNIYYYFAEDSSYMLELPHYTTLVNISIYIFVSVKACNYFACTSSEKSKSFIALYVVKSLAVTSTSQAKNGVLKACCAAAAI